VVRELVAKALKGPLLPAQQQQVLAELEANPKLVHALGLGADQLPALVENTPVIAYEVLLRLMRSRHIHRYFQVWRCVVWLGWGAVVWEWVGSVWFGLGAGGLVGWGVVAGWFG